MIFQDFIIYIYIYIYNLLNTLYKIIDFVFSGETKKAIAYIKSSAFWTNSTKYFDSFTKTSLKNALKQLILESCFTIGNTVLLQTIGISMGIDPAPFWANLYLYKHECDFMTELIHSDKARGRKYHGAFRFIDDQCCINDSNDFEKPHNQIYPTELELKVKHSGNHATFLDLEITLNDGYL